MNGKIIPGWWGWRVPAYPLSLYLPSRTKLWCALQLRGADTLPLFLLYPFMPFVLCSLTHLSLKVSLHKICHPLKWKGVKIRHNLYFSVILSAWNKEVIWNGHGYRQSHWVRLTVTVCILFCSWWECAWVHYRGKSLIGDSMTDGWLKLVFVKEILVRPMRGCAT